MRFPFPRFPARRCGSLALLLAGVIVMAVTGILRAGPPESAAKSLAEPETDPIFHRGAFELQAMTGAFYSLQYTSTLRPNIDYAPVVLRLGYMADNVYGHGFLRGNDEFMVEAIGAPIFVGPGSGLGGLSLIYRRNFLSPGARVVPYFTAGAGGIYSDAYHDRNQGALGAPFEFDLQGAVGVRFRLAPQLTVDTEFSYRHLSNAGLGERNLGTNAIGGMVGLSYGF